MNSKGVLYIVATPIGNLGDITQRALEVLGSSDLIAAEDTRHSQNLLRHYGIGTPMLAYHDHSDDAQTERLIAKLQEGASIALISDAGTPLISDPGYALVHSARQQDIRVVPVPGVSAVITALSAAGLPTDRFAFEGFLPAKSGARRAALEKLADDSRTLVFYESPHRIEAALADALTVLGPDRELVMARELTKTFETFLHGDLAQLLERVRSDANQQKGEIVLMLRAKPSKAGDGDAIPTAAEKMLKRLLQDLPTKKAAAITAEFTGLKKNQLYQHALTMGKASD